MMRNRLIYLAQPLTHKSKKIEKARYIAGAKVSAKLFDMGICHIPPITINYPLKIYMDNSGTTWKDWKRVDETYISRCDEMWVIDLEGWDKSIGVRAEIKFCLKHKIPIRLLDSKEFLVIYPTKKELFKLLNITKVEELND